MEKQENNLAGILLFWSCGYTCLTTVLWSYSLYLVYGCSQVSGAHMMLGWSVIQKFGSIHMMWYRVSDHSLVMLCLLYILKSILKCLALWVKFSADNILKYSFYFFQKTGFGISGKLSPVETICMKCQNQFMGKIRKIFQYVFWKFYPEDSSRWHSKKYFLLFFWENKTWHFMRIIVQTQMKCDLISVCTVCHLFSSFKIITGRKMDLFRFQDKLVLSSYSVWMIRVVIVHVLFQQIISLCQWPG